MIFTHVSTDKNETGSNENINNRSFLFCQLKLAVSIFPRGDTSRIDETIKSYCQSIRNYLSIRIETVT